MANIIMFKLIFSALCLWGVIYSAAYMNASNSTNSHNFFAGTVRPYDILLARHEIMKPGATRLGVGIKTIEEYTYPPPGVVGRAIISAVMVYDKVTNGTGGYVNSMAFGPGYKNVTLRLKSQKSRGYHFLIEVFGY